MINYLTIELLEERESEIEEFYTISTLHLMIDNARIDIEYSSKTIPKTECNPEETKYELESWNCNVKNNLKTSDVKELFHSYLN